MSNDAMRAALLERDREWAAVSYQGADVDRILSYWSQDALVVPAGIPPVKGQAALRDYVETSLSLPGFSITWESTDATVSADGTMAWLIGRNTVTFAGEDGAIQSVEGRVVTVWQRDDVGSDWRCVVDIWNS
jgi:ketosteroid isomerase-like protein